MNPTKEQQQWLWEKCGFKWADAHNPDCNCGAEMWCYIAPNGRDYAGRIGYHENGLPELDLNNLFKYAVPKLDLQQIIIQPDLVTNYYVGLTVGDKLYESGHQDPALALFWVLYKALGGKE